MLLIAAVQHSDSEKAMAPHSSTLAWKILWMEKPGRLQSMGSLRVGYDWATWLSLFTFMHWRRKWQPTPVFLPGESQGRRGLVGCHLWSRTELDTTEATAAAAAAVYRNTTEFPWRQFAETFYEWTFKNNFYQLNCCFPGDKVCQVLSRSPSYPRFIFLF